MVDQTNAPYRSTIRWLLALLLIAFLSAFYFVVQPFFTPLLWAIVLATATWPLFKRLRTKLPSPTFAAPLVLTLILGAVLLVVVVPLPLQLASEIRSITSELRVIERSNVTQKITELPLVGPHLATVFESLLTDPNGLGSLISEHQAGILSVATAAARGVLSTIITAIASLVGCFFLYRYGESLLEQLRNILIRIGGPKIPELIETVHLTVKGAAYSVIATAFAQGVLAGIGYAIAGAPVPLLLALLTTVASLIPFGPPLVYLPVCAYLLFFQALPWYHAVGLAVWAIVVVSTIDNVLRPLFISQQTQLSAALVFIGVLGGVLSFGLLGVFIGPVLMAVGHWLWAEFSRPGSAEDILS
jgi:predicted PurR-regulated permease PerM